MLIQFQGDRANVGACGNREDAAGYEYLRSGANKMTRFGSLLRVHRRQCRDSLRGGMLTQERLGELLGNALGHAGYSGAAVSDWERDKSKIDEDDRPVLLALISVLVECHGLRTLAEANALLYAGNYRALDGEEQATIFGQRADPPLVNTRPLAASAALQMPPADAPDSSGAQAWTTAPEPNAERQKLMILLQKVRRFWIDGVLQTALAGSPRLEIVWHRRPGAVEQPWEALVHPALYGDPEGQTVAAEFDNADRALLIQGEAGAGKTITLLRLAQALGARAAASPTAAVPVVLNLSSWATDRQRLADWVIEELTAKYQIPRRIGRPWLEEDALVLLLDGFDELPPLQRPACARAINAFRREWGLTGIAVCTRTAEYEAAGVRLKLGGAIRLRPLSAAQCEAYLTAMGAPLAGLRQALTQDATLQELARSPLFLDVMSVVFRGATTADVNGLTGAEDEPANSISATRERLFQAYEQRMMQLHGPHALYSPQQTARWLYWLAAQMDRHDQAVFLLEEIQPSWLRPRDRRIYLLLAHLIAGLAAGILLWLLLQWLRNIIPRFPAVVAPPLAERLGISQGRAEPLVLLGGSVALALVAALVHLWTFRPISPVKRVGNSPLRRRAISVGLLTGFPAAATVAVFGPLPLALSWGLAMGFTFGMISRYLTGRDYRHDIQPVEALGWSWREAGKGLLIGLILAGAAEILETALFGFNGVARSILFFGLAGFLAGGLRGQRIEKKSALNQGIRLSLRSAVASAFIISTTLTALTLLMRTPIAAGYTALLTGLVVLPFFGGATVLKHYLLRLLLWREGNMPLRYGRFLEHAAQFGLLRRVGGGYTFMHRLMQEHFAGRA